MNHLRQACSCNHHLRSWGTNRVHYTRSLEVRKYWLPQLHFQLALRCCSCIQEGYTRSLESLPLHVSCKSTCTMNHLRQACSCNHHLRSWGTNRVHYTRSLEVRKCWLPQLHFQLALRCCICISGRLHQVVGIAAPARFVQVHMYHEPPPPGVQLQSPSTKLGHKPCPLHSVHLRYENVGCRNFISSL